MADIKEGLMPDKVVLLVQAAVYLTSVVSSYVLIIKPMLRIHQEREKRTRGSLDKAEVLLQNAQSLEKNIDEKRRTALIQAKEYYENLKQDGYKEVQKIIEETQEKVRKTLKQKEDDLQKVMAEEKQKIPESTRIITQDILKKIGFIIFLLFFCGKNVSTAWASGSFADSIGWPYFHFILYFALLVYAIKKIVPPILESRRENLKQQLAKARESLQQAEQRLEACENLMTNLDKELEALKQKYIAEGEKEKQRIIQEGLVMAQRLQEDAERLVNDMMLRARDELRKEILKQAFVEVENYIRQKKLEEIALVDKKFHEKAFQAVQSLRIQL